MAELPNLRTVSEDYRVFLDQDDTLANSNAFPDLYAAIGNPEQLIAERDGQRERSRAAAAAQGTLVVPPYDIFDHLGPSPDPAYGITEPYNLSEEDILAIAHQAREGRPSPLFPDALRLLDRLERRRITPTIYTYGDPATQKLKVVLNGLDGYPVEVATKLKRERLEQMQGPGMHVDDRAKHVPRIGHGAITGVLYNPSGNPIPKDYDGPVIQSHDELWR